MTFSDGFTRGFGLMDAYYSRQDQKARQDKYDAQNEVRFQREQRDWGYQDEQRQNARDDRKHGLERRAVIEGREDENWDRSKVLREREDTQWQDGRDDREHALARRPTLEAQQDELSRVQIGAAKSAWAQNSLKFEQQQAERAYTNLAMGTVTEEDAEFFRKHPKYDPIRATGYDTQHVLSVLQDAANPNTDTQVNDPQVLKAANLFFYDELQKGSPGEKRIAGVHPGKKKGTLVFDLEVTAPDGSKTRAPMTVGRGSEKDAEVLQVPLEQIMDRIQGAQFLREALMSKEFAPGLEAYKTRYGATQKIGPMMEQRINYLKDTLKNLNEQYAAVQSNAQGIVDPKELERIEGDIQATREQLSKLIGIEPNVSRRDPPPAEWSNDPEENIRIAIEWNKARGVEITRDEAIRMVEEASDGTMSAPAGSPQQGAQQQSQQTAPQPVAGQQAQQPQAPGLEMEQAEPEQLPPTGAGLQQPPQVEQAPPMSLAETAIDAEGKQFEGYGKKLVGLIEGGADAARKAKIEDSAYKKTFGVSRREAQIAEDRFTRDLRQGVTPSPRETEILLKVMDTLPLDLKAEVEKIARHQELIK